MVSLVLFCRSSSWCCWLRIARPQLAEKYAYLLPAAQTLADMRDVGLPGAAVKLLGATQKLMAAPEALAPIFRKSPAPMVASKSTAGEATLRAAAPPSSASTVGRLAHVDRRPLGQREHRAPSNSCGRASKCSC